MKENERGKEKVKGKQYREGEGVGDKEEGKGRERAWVRDGEGREKG